MDIRVQAYRPVTVQSFAGQGGLAVAVSDARLGGPVQPIQAIGGNSAKAPSQNDFFRGNGLTANNGYTDATRGSRINILA